MAKRPPDGDRVRNILCQILPSIPHNTVTNTGIGVPADDLDKLNSLVESKTTRTQPEFFPEPSCPFYEYPLGALSPYGAHPAAWLLVTCVHRHRCAPAAHPDTACTCCRDVLFIM